MTRDKNKGYGFGTFQGVFTPSILTIIGVVLYLRFGWMLGNVGLATSLVIVTIGSAITFLTGLSISALATNMRMKGGGAYFMISRSLGPEAGAAIGLPLAAAQAIGVSFYIAGFAEALTECGIPWFSVADPRWVGLVTLAIMAFIATVNANIALKTQYFIMAAIVLSLVSFFLGGTPSDLEALKPVEALPEKIGFWPVFAVFFPAVTGILSGVGMSGDLKNPGRSIPIGTIAAVLVGYAIYMAVPVMLDHMVSDADILRNDKVFIMRQCARWQWLILLGVAAATLSSAIGSFLCAPRVLQALSRDRLLPSFLARGYGKSDDPRFASAFCFVVAAAGVWLGDINVIAPILTLFNLSTYSLLNLVAALEEMMANPAWRPTFRVKAVFSFAGFIGCIGAMFMISPGWTFVALICEAGIYYFVARRSLSARWGDMRTGLFVYGVRLLLRRLNGGEAFKAHAWRPNLLVFSGASYSRDRLVEFASAISGNRSLSTFAVIVNKMRLTYQRRRDLTQTLQSRLARRGIDVQVLVNEASDLWSGMREMVRVYGYGPLVPNTVILGQSSEMPQTDGVAAAGVVVETMRQHKNIVILQNGRRGALIPHTLERRIDVWWRGKSGNAAFMLALACLIRRSEAGCGCKLRLCHLQETGESVDAVREVMAKFLRDARIDAEQLVVPRIANSDVVERIATISSSSGLVFIGLRPVAENESPEEYGKYLSNLRSFAGRLPQVVFACATEDVDFNSIFKV